MKIIFVRHGQEKPTTDDDPLTKIGKKQARLLGKRLRKMNMIKWGKKDEVYNWKVININGLNHLPDKLGTV